MRRVETKLLASITKQRQFVILRGHGAVVQDDGSLHDWIAALVRKLPRQAHPQLVIVCRRMVSASKRAALDGLHFEVVHSLTREQSIDLFSLWLKELDAACSASLANQLVESVVGHPRYIELAARYVKEVGVASIEANPASFMDVLRARSEALIESISPNPSQQKLLMLFLEFEYLSGDDLLTAMECDSEATGGTGDRLQTSLNFLQEHAILESDGRYLRIAPYLTEALSRFRRKWKTSETNAFMERIQNRFIDRVNKMTTTDLVEISTIDKAVLILLRAGRLDDGSILKRAMLPSHQLRVARELYNDQRYVQSADLCGRALDRKFLLTPDATIEALRLRALSLARIGENTQFQACVEELRRFNHPAARRNVQFLRGYKFHWDGKMERAEECFREAYKLGGEKNFYVLRELAQVLVAQGRFAEAEEFARDALSVAPSNAYIIDNLLEILIERHSASGSGGASLADDTRVENLLAQLRNASASENRSFYEARIAHYFFVLGDLDRALDSINDAVRLTPKVVAVHLIRIRILLAKGMSSEAGEKLKDLQRLFDDMAENGDRRQLHGLIALKVRLEIERKNYAAARGLIDRGGMPAAVRTKLSAALAQAVVSARGSDDELMAWARDRVRSGAR